MHQHRTKRYRFRSNGSRGDRRNNNIDNSLRRAKSSMTGGHLRYNSFRGNQNAGKLIERYQNLAKEALSSGDNILSENYLQHADHFMRIVASKNENQTNVENLNTSTKPEISTETKVNKLNQEVDKKE